MGFLIIGLILAFRFGWKRNFLAFLCPLLLVLMIAWVRSKLWSERLAVLELLIPAVVLTLRLCRSENWNIWRRFLTAAAPIAGPPLLFLFFSISEYSRSWSGFYSETQDSFLLFSFMRLTGYYATALNNGAASVEILHHYNIPFHSLDWFWRFPLVKAWMPYESIANSEPWNDYGNMLMKVANPEFNNPSGIFVVRLDYGYTGGLFAWFALGIISMLLYRSFVKGNLSGLLLYPFFFIGLLESPRILYWSLSRCFPTWALLFFVLLLALFTSQVVRRRPISARAWSCVPRDEVQSLPGGFFPHSRCRPGYYLRLSDLSSGVATAAAADESPLSLPKLNCPVYVMEYHVWYRSPFGSGPQPGYAHWGDPEHIDFTLPSDQSVRDIGSSGYPLLGLYDSENPDLIRWQLRCAHNSGIDGLFVHLFPDRATGTSLGGSRLFAAILRLAREENVKVAVHDEVMFRTGWKAQQPSVMAERISGFIKRFGSDPAYLKIDGHPVYAFQYWTKFISPDQMSGCLDQAERLAGTPIHFLIMGGATQLYQRPSPASFVVGGNSMFIKTNKSSDAPNPGDWIHLNADSLNLSILHSFYPKHKFGLWAYPGFNNQSQSRMLNDSPVRTFSRQNGDILAKTLATYNRVHPDFIILSSWNDWMEGTAIEPGLSL